MQSLSVKYRPKTFDEIVSQESIIKILNRQLELGEIKNTYLFCGASGCGKTTVARAFANAINGGIGNPIEIDGASNNGVDNVKQIIKSATERSIDSKYKIYIIDECFDGSVEVLTSEGYKRFDSLSGNEKIAQYTDDGEIEFVIPTEYLHIPYKGDMYKVSLRNGKRTCLMSPHHVQPLRMKKSKKLKESYIKDCKFAQSNELVVSGRGNAKYEALSSFERLIIAAQADGYCNKDKLKDGTFNWEFHLSTVKKKKRLTLLLEECNIPYRIYGSTIEQEGASSIQCHLPSNNYKIFSNNFEYAFNVNRAREFIDEILEWDGSRKSGYPGYYSSTVKENVDFVSAVLVQAGYSGCCNVHEYENDNYSTEYSINWYYVDSRPATACSKEIVHDYNGTIYCVKVPSKKIVVRVEGFTFISGNCHALSNAAWQAFLKCIEEPPTYTIFIFATTDPQKIPSTILNRVMRFNFTRISSDKIRDRLLFICSQEGFTNYIDACDYISRISNNQMRDAIATLEKCADYDKDLSIENVLNAVGSYSYDVFFDLINFVIDGNIGEVMNILTYLYNKGNDMRLFVDQFLSFNLDICKYSICKSVDITKLPNSYEQKLIASTNFDNPGSYYCYVIDKLLELKNMLKNDTVPRDTIEVMFTRLCRGV